MSTAAFTTSVTCAPPATNGENTPDADATLMLEVAADSEAAFVELVRRHQKSLLNFFVRSGASSDSEDLVQETFVRLFRARGSIVRLRASRRFLCSCAECVGRSWAKDRAFRAAQRGLAK
jgi:DNA-directed RNA polymerase specialized sigma24 family protein